MIQIIAGTFGYYDGRKVIPITEASGPQKFDPELEARLVKKGVAKYVGAPAADQPDPDDTKLQDPDDTKLQDPDPAGAEGKPEYSEDMKLDELKAIAETYGIDASAMRKKAEVIAAIEAAKLEIDADDEEPPQPSVADPV